MFWLVDNGTIDRGQAAIDRLQSRWENLVLVHLPKHVSWLNQIESYFSILARKALTLSHFDSIEELTEQILGLQTEFAKTAAPFRLDLHPTRPPRPPRPTRSARPTHAGRQNELR